MNIAGQIKAVAAAIGGGVATGGVGAVALPEGTPWWGYLIVILFGMLLPYATTYLAPKNAPPTP